MEVFRKLQRFCSFIKKSNVKLTRSMRAFGIERNLQWLWIDTACIDKRSSAELTESINSILHYYASSELCFGYLQDVGSLEDHPGASLDSMHSEWFRRGWTLPEILAPRTVVFLNKDWGIIGHKCRLQTCDMTCRRFGICLNKTISLITGISNEFLFKTWTADSV